MDIRKTCSIKVEKMKFETKEFLLKDGRTAVLKNPGEEEIQGLLDYLTISSGETDFLLRYPEECGRYTYEAEKDLIENMKASENDLFLTCTVDGKVAGNCHLFFNDRVKTRHRASVAIALLKDYWSLGIGTVMFECMIRAAEEKEGVLQLELEVIEGNDRAMALYKKMGFREYGVRPDAIRLKDGTMLSETMMLRKL